MSMLPITFQASYVCYAMTLHRNDGYITLAEMHPENALTYESTKKEKNVRNSIRFQK